VCRSQSSANGKDKRNPSCFCQVSNPPFLIHPSRNLDSVPVIWMQQQLCPHTHPPTLMVWIGTALHMSLFKAGISDDTMYHQMVMNNELEVMWKEAIRAWFCVLSWHITGGTEEKHRTIWAVLVVLTKIQSCNLLSKSFQYYHLS